MRIIHSFNDFTSLELMIESIADQLRNERIEWQIMNMFSNPNNAQIFQILLNHV